MRPLLVVGYGNPLRRDDAFGRRVVAALEGRWPGELVRLESAHQLLIEHCALAAESGCVIFVDARVGASPGAVSLLEVGPGPCAPSSPLAHHLTPELLLRASEEFYGRRPEARLVTVDAADLEQGEGLSGPVEAALPCALRVVGELIDERLGGASHA